VLGTEVESQVVYTLAIDHAVVGGKTQNITLEDGERVSYSDRVVATPDLALEETHYWYNKENFFFNFLGDFETNPDIDLELDLDLELDID
jgi:hypothetical protein